MSEEKNNDKIIKEIIDNYENQKDNLFISIKEITEYIKNELSFIKDNISVDIGMDIR